MQRLFFKKVSYVLTLKCWSQQRYNKYVLEYADLKAIIKFIKIDSGIINIKVIY